MTPKEKAIELVEKFEDNLIECDTYFLQEAKKRCALIAVDELIIQENKYNNGSFYPLKYWKAVKQEIEKL